MTLTHEPLSSVETLSPAPDYPYDESHIGLTELKPTHRVDLRPDGPDVFYDADPVNDWASLTWDAIGRPYRVERWSSEKKAWEKEHNQDMPVKTAWEKFKKLYMPALLNRKRRYVLGSTSIPTTFLSRTTTRIWSNSRCSRRLTSAAGSSQNRSEY